MTQLLQNIDNDILLFFNGLHNFFFDPIMYNLSGKWVWVAMYVALAYTFIARYGWKRGLVLILAIGAAVACADLFSAKAIRPLCERLRPSNPENEISSLVHIVNNYRGGRYGFPSCHAANTFALAVASSLMLKYKPFTCFIFLWALLQCYTRLYLGVHYLSDLLAGALIGTAFGYLAYKATISLSKKAVNKKADAMAAVWVGVVTIAVTCALS